MIKRLLISFGVIAGTSATLLFCIHPNTGRKKTMYSRFKDYYIAHRGLFDNPETPENSLSAFSKAVKNGYGIELDVQLTADNKIVVFHDETLQRMCGNPKTLRDLSYKELRSFYLLGTRERIPLLKDVLDLVNGQVPIFVEIKPEGRFMECAKRTAAILKKYKGTYCVQSFNPFILLDFRKNAPGVLRGQLSTVFTKDVSKYSPLLRFFLSNLLFNCFSRPDFISYNHEFSDKTALRICTRLFKSLTAAWTIKSADDLKKAKKDFDFFIFEGFRP